MRTERTFTGSGLRAGRPAAHEPFERRELVPTVPTGIQQFAGSGITRHCMGCDMHRKLHGSNGKRGALLWRCWWCVAQRAARAVA